MGTPVRLSTASTCFYSADTQCFSRRVNTLCCCVIAGQRGDTVWPRRDHRPVRLRLTFNLRTLTTHLLSLVDFLRFQTLLFQLVFDAETSFLQFLRTTLTKSTRAIYSRGSLRFEANKSQRDCFCKELEWNVCDSMCMNASWSSRFWDASAVHYRIKFSFDPSRETRADADLGCFLHFGCTSCTHCVAKNSEIHSVFLLLWSWKYVTGILFTRPERWFVVGVFLGNNQCLIKIELSSQTWGPDVEFHWSRPLWQTSSLFTFLYFKSVLS